MPKTGPHVLVVEDDTAVRTLIITTLDTQGYVHMSAATAQAALASVTTANPDVVLLDLGLPDFDGIDVIRKVRSWSQIPIIVISARTEDADKIEALDAGADDYLTKPFSVGELLARLRTALRHAHYLMQTDTSDDTTFTNGDLTVDYAAGCATLAGTELHLTPIEFKLLCILSRNVDKVLTHQYLLREVWGSTEDTYLASLRVFMGTLRKKIEEDPSHPRYIQTHVGIGYRMIRTS